MNILFSIQGTGNGHLSRAREIIPFLQQHGQVDLLVSGTQSDVQLPYLVKYKKRGISFTFGKNGGVDKIDTLVNLRPFNFFKDIFTFPVQQYDLVINDFEPVTAWACKIKRKQCISLSHQAAYLSPLSPRPAKRDGFAESVFRNYAPCSEAVGFHFDRFDHYIHTPVIRSDVRKREPKTGNHIAVYLPAHDDALLVKSFSQVKEVNWEVFTKHSKTSYQTENVRVIPIENDAFMESLAGSCGLVTAGGFETPAEAIFLGKKVLSIPMFDQYEQLCNAEAMKKMGVTVLSRTDDQFVPVLKKWLAEAKPLTIHYPDNTEQIVSRLIVESQKENRFFYDPGKLALS